MTFWRVALAVMVCVGGMGSVQAAKPLILPSPVGESLPIEVTPVAREIQVDVPDTSAMGAQFGLIGAIMSSAMDNAAAKKAEARMAPIRDRLIDVHFADDVQKTLSERLPGSGVAVTPVLTFRSGDEQPAAAAPTTPPPMQMTIIPRYAFDTVMSRMYVRLNVMVGQNTPKSNGKYKSTLLMSRNYSYGFALDKPGKPEENEARWLALPPAQLSAWLHKGLEQAVAMVVYDFSEQGRAEWNLEPPKPERRGMPPARPISNSDGTTWSRLGKGWWQSIDGVETVGVVASADAAPTGSTTP